MASTALSAGKVMLVVLFAGSIIIGGFYFFMKRRKWDFQVVYLNQDGVTGGIDQGSIFVDRKTKVKRFWLKRANVSMPPDNFPWRLIGNKRTVFVQRFGVKNFAFVDTKGLGLGAKAEVSEEDVNWAVVDYEKQKLAFSSDKLMQVLPYIIFGVAVIGSVIVIWILVNKFSVLNEIATKLQATAQILANSASGTKVVPS